MKKMKAEENERRRRREMKTRDGEDEKWTRERPTDIDLVSCKRRPINLVVVQLD